MFLSAEDIPKAVPVYGCLTMSAIEGHKDTLMRVRYNPKRNNAV